MSFPVVDTINYTLLFVESIYMNTYQNKSRMFLENNYLCLLIFPSTHDTDEYMMNWSIGKGYCMNIIQISR